MEGKRDSGIQENQLRISYQNTDCMYLLGITTFELIVC